MRISAPQELPAGERGPAEHEDSAGEPGHHARVRAKAGRANATTSAAPRMSMTAQPTAAPAIPGTAYMTKLTISPQSAGPTTRPCARADNSSSWRSAVRTTTNPTVASAASSAASRSKPGRTDGSTITATALASSLQVGRGD